MKVSDFLEHSTAVHPDRVAVTHGKRNITYSQLYKAVVKLSGKLQEMPVETGSQAAILFENSVDYVVCFLAVLTAGFVVVPLDTSANPLTLHNILNDCKPPLFLCQAKFRRHLPGIIGDSSPITQLVTDKEINVDFDGIHRHTLEELIGEIDSVTETDVPAPRELTLSWEESPTDLTAIFYTSGSTGDAKGVMLSHQNLTSNTLSTVEYLKLTHDDTVMVILPFYYIYGNSLLLTHIACGGRLVIDNRFLYPEVILDTMESEKVTGFSGVPSNFIILLNNSTFRERELPDLRYFTQAGGAMAPEIISQLMEAYPQKEIWIMYGQTEASPRATYLPPEKLEEKLGSIGIAVPGVKLSVVNDDGVTLPPGKVGQILVDGPNVMLGYWNQPEETASVIKNGCLITGDLARQDEDGYFHIVGRKKEIIKTGGNRVSAKEVEECLLRNSDVLEVAVFGVPDDLLGEAVKAVIVLKDGGKVDPKQIRDHCKKYLSSHKAPKIIDFAESLPKYQSGKINKQLLVNQQS